MPRFHKRLVISDPQPALSSLRNSCGLSGSEIKKAMQCGAVWLKRSSQKNKRVRKAKFPLLPGDLLDIYYDSTILNLTLEHPPELLKETHQYSIWYKPPMVMSQGSLYGDHLSLLRYAEKYFGYRNRLHLVHRLDRETGGLVILAHTKQAASDLSSQFSNRTIQKTYKALVCGNLTGESESSLSINTHLGNKPALTIVRLLGYSDKDDFTRVIIDLKTGRYHQIRRHMKMIGHPVCGDKRYGRGGGKSFNGLQLYAWKLAFRDPHSSKKVEITLPVEFLPEELVF